MQMSLGMLLSDFWFCLLLGWLRIYADHVAIKVVIKGLSLICIVHMVVPEKLVLISQLAQQNCRG